MPKRTNDFQALIALVERQLAASGVRVVESEMLADRLTGELREVDVCVHATVSGKDVTLALECRDHKRKADQIWIDTLRGKYANLPVDKVIAVAGGLRQDGARGSREGADPDTHTRRSNVGELAPDRRVTGRGLGRCALSSRGERLAASGQAPGAHTRHDDGRRPIPEAWRSNAPAGGRSTLVLHGIACGAVYPYTDISAYIPRDFLWMYPALVPAPLFVILLSGIQERAMAGRKRFGGLAVAFGVMAATLLTADYFIQLRVIQPAVLKGELEGLAPLTQYNPHGVFIALEEAGYLFMAVAFLFAALALSARNRLYRATRWVFAGGFTAAMLLFLVLSFAYGLDVEYRFEVAAITVDWTVLIVVGTLLAFAYRRGASEP